MGSLVPMFFEVAGSFMNISGVFWNFKYDLDERQSLFPIRGWGFELQCHSVFFSSSCPFDPQPNILIICLWPDGLK